MQVTKKPVEFSEDVKRIILLLGELKHYVDKVHTMFLRASMIIDNELYYHRENISYISVITALRDMISALLILPDTYSIYKQLLREELLKPEILNLNKLFEKEIMPEVESDKNKLMEIYRKIEETGKVDLTTLHNIDRILTYWIGVSKDLFDRTYRLFLEYSLDPPEYDVWSFAKVLSIAIGSLIVAGYVLSRI